MHPASGPSSIGRGSDGGVAEAQERELQLRVGYAVNALTQAGARGLAEYDIAVNAFAPGVVQTPLWTQLDADLVSIGDADHPGQAIADFGSDILRGRVATPEDITGTALYLASSDSDHLTGQVIMIDGGMVLV